MISLIGRKVSIVRCANPAMTGRRGAIALESMHTVTMLSGSRRIVIPKTGTVMQLLETGVVVIGDEMEGRLADRIARGSRV